MYMYILSPESILTSTCFGIVTNNPLFITNLSRPSSLQWKPLVFNRAVEETGNDNGIPVEDTGNHNEITVEETGNHNEIPVEETGNHNEIPVEETGNDNGIPVEETGNHNEIIIFVTPQSIITYKP